MKIYSVYDPEFAAYGKVLGQYDTAQLLEAMEKIAAAEAEVNERITGSAAGLGF